MPSLHEIAAIGDVDLLLNKIAELKPLETKVTDKTKNSIISLDTPDNNGITPLQYAVINNHVKMIEVLVDMGAKINKKTKNKISGTMMSTLQYAIHYGKAEAVKKLIELKADVKILFEQGFTPLHYAAKLGMSSIIEILISDAKLDPNKTTHSTDKITPAHLIAMNNNLDSAKNLSKWGMNIKAKIKSGETPLYYAYIYGYLDVAKTLIAQGAGTSIFPVNLETVFTVFGGEKLSHLFTSKEISKLDIGGDPISSLKILMFYLTKFFIELSFDNSIANKILTLLRSKYTSNSESDEALVEKIQNNQSVLLGTGDSEHFIVAQLYKLDHDKVTLLLYDKGLLVGKEDHNNSGKFFCVRSLCLKNDSEQLQKVIAKLKKTKECDEQGANELFDDIQTEVGQKYSFLDYPTQKIYKIEKCYSANYNLTLCNLFINEMGIKSGLMTYKNFTTFFRKSVAQDFQSHSNIAKELKIKIKSATNEIIEKKEQLCAVRFT